MKNVRDTQLKKVIFMGYSEFKELIETLTDGLLTIGYEYGMYYEDTVKAEVKKTFMDIDKITGMLSEYFGVNVTSVHSDDFDEIGIWICYKD